MVGYSAIIYNSVASWYYNPLRFAQIGGCTTKRHGMIGVLWDSIIESLVLKLSHPQPDANCTSHTDAILTEVRTSTARQPRRKERPKAPTNPRANTFH
jgi:hypothetical protein